MAKLVDEKNNVILSQKYPSMMCILQNLKKKKLFNRKLICFVYEKRYKKQKKYMSPNLEMLILYSIRVCMETPKYKMTEAKLICYFSTKFDKQSLTMFILAILNHYIIAFTKWRIKKTNQASGLTQTRTP